MEKTFKAIGQKNQMLPEQVAEQIKELIIGNNWEAGHKLPNEFEMADQLQVGRGTIREAIKILVAQNIVEIKRGRGTFVCEKPGMVDDPLGLSFMNDKHKLAIDMCETRLMIEPQIAEMAAQRATIEDIEKLEILCDAVEAKIRQNVEHGQEDISFHEAIAACTGNQVVQQIVPIIQSSIMLFIDITRSGLKHHTIEEHRQLVEAIKDHDGKRASEVMTAHILQNQRNIEAITKASQRGDNYVKESGVKKSSAGA